MNIRFGLPLWALLCAIPVAAITISANVNADNSDIAVQADDVVNNDMNVDADASELSLDDGATDNWRRWRRYGGWYGGYGSLYSSWYNPYLYGYGYGYGYPWYSSYWY